MVLKNPSRVLLSSLRHLTFYAGELTESRRSDPIAQLDCDDTDQGGKLCTKYAPDVVQCANIDPNESGQMPDWRCEANLPDTVRLGRVQVSCEGFSAPRDPYVLRGSCGLTYRLLPAADSPDQGRIDIGSTIIGLIFFCVFTFIILAIVRSFLQCTYGQRYIQLPSDDPPFGGGGGGDDPGPGPSGQPPPPPYTPTDTKSSVRPRPTQSWTQGPGHDQGQAEQEAQAEHGFGSGTTFAAGAAAGVAGLSLAQRFWRWFVTPAPPANIAPGQGGVDDLNQPRPWEDYNRGWRDGFNRGNGPFGRSNDNWRRRTHGWDRPYPSRSPSPSRSPRAPSPGPSTQVGFGGTSTR